MLDKLFHNNNNMEEEEELNKLNMCHEASLQ